MGSDEKRGQHDLARLLNQLRESWGTEQSGSTVRSMLTDLIDKTTLATVPPRAHSNNRITTSGDAQNTHDAAAPLLVRLFDLARFVLGLDSAAKSRCRALALDCLRAGLAIAMGESEVDARDALSLAATGAKDDKWNVRAAAARVVGEVVGGGGDGSNRRLLSLLSSKSGCWLPAMLADEYPEVQECARAAVGAATTTTTTPENAALVSSSANASAPPSCSRLPESPARMSVTPLWSLAAATAVVHTARDILLTPLSSSTSSSRLTPGEICDDLSVLVDLDAESTSLTALRALRGVSSLGLLSRHLLMPAATIVEGLQGVEAWLGKTLSGPPPALPWEAGRGGNAPQDGAPGRRLTLEARDTIRALACSGEGAGEIELAAVGAVEGFRDKCCRRGGGGQRRAEGDKGQKALEDQEEEEEEEEEEDTMWRRLYCGLLVQLEALMSAHEALDDVKATLPQRAGVQSVFGSENGEGTPVNESLEQGGVSQNDEEMHQAYNTVGVSSSRRHDDVESVTTRDGENSSAEHAFHSWWAVVGTRCAEALEEVPFAHAQAVPATEQDHGKLSASELGALRRRGYRSQQWMISCVHLLLRTGTRCVKASRGAAAAAEFTAVVSGICATDTEVIIKLLVTAMQFRHAYTQADDPTDAWLSCVKSDSDPALATPSSVRFRKTSGKATATTSTKATTTTTTKTSPIPAAQELMEPISWEFCIASGQKHLRRRALPAPWATDPPTHQLAAELIEATWRGLSLDGTGVVAKRSAEALVQALRTISRTRGWREDAGVAVKHAVAGVVRRLRSPLVSGATLGHMLPLALPLASDHDISHQAVGFSLMLHVASEATPTELSWHRGLLLEVLERGLRAGGRDPSASILCLAAAVKLLRRAPGGRDIATHGGGEGSLAAARSGLRLTRETLAQAGRTQDGEVRVVMLAGAAALLEIPATTAGFAACEILRPALLCLLPILQSAVVSPKLDARAPALRALHTLCLACWPRVHAHAAKLLCALLWTCGDCTRRCQGRETIAGKTSTRRTTTINNNAGAASVSMHERVGIYATRLGALVVVLSGDTGRSMLREACCALSDLRQVGSAMEELADKASSVVDGTKDGEGAGGNIGAEGKA